MKKAYRQDLVKEVAETLRSLVYDRRNSWDEESIVTLHVMMFGNAEGDIDTMIRDLAEYSVNEDEDFCESEIAEILERK